MTNKKKQGNTPLEELPEKWRDEMVLAADREQQMINTTLEKCATELERTIEDND